MGPGINNVTSINHLISSSIWKLFYVLRSTRNFKMSKEEFQVIIVGGSIGGLKIAHWLQRAGVSHIVLEKSSDPAPQIGASIGILPNGARVLDQLQLYDEVERYIEPLKKAIITFADGFSFSSYYPTLINERFDSLKPW